MKPTANFALTYPESGDHTRTWEYWQSLATQVDDLLSGKTNPAPFVLDHDVSVGKLTDATERMLKIARISAGVGLESRHRVFPTGGGGGQGTVVSSEIWENGAEVAQFNYRRDGQLLLKSGGAAGLSRPVPFAMESKLATIQLAGVSNATVDWTFKAGRFTVAPVVVTTPVSQLWVTGTQFIDTTKATVYARNFQGANGGGPMVVHCLAIQMTPSTAEG